MPRKGTGVASLEARNVPRHPVIASGTAHGTPGTAVTVTLTGGTASGYQDLTNAELLALARRDFRVVQTLAGAAGAFNISAANAVNGTIDVTCTAASLTFEVVVT